MSTAPVPSLLEFDRQQVCEWVEGKGQRSFRGDQIWRWIFEKRVSDFTAMVDLPKGLRSDLAENFRLFSGEVERRLFAKDRTEKLLIRLDDGNLIETVLMREPRRRTICISTQVGCAMGCVFCASGLLGVKRNLTRGEILEQILRIRQRLEPNETLTNIVVMGIGEPLANLKNLIPVLETACDANGLGLSPRRITVSTVGLPDKIRELADWGRPINLAISIHAPNDELRTQIVPVNKSIGIDAIFSAADYFFERTGRRVTYEYVLLSGVNDGERESHELGGLLSSRNAHVNLIPMNNVAGLEFVEPTRPRTDAFRDTLESYGVATTIRKRKGADIDAACGQLRLKQSEPQPISLSAN